MKRIFIAATAFLAIVSCQRPEELAQTGDASLFHVTFGAESSSSDSKVYVSDLKRCWSEGDAIGLFTDGNTNVKADLVSGSGTQSARFDASMSAVTTASTLYAYYPYNSDVTDPSAIPVSLTDQVYEGDYTAEGAYTSYGKYALMAASLSGFTVNEQSGWPDGKVMSFASFTGVARFKLTTDVAEGLNIKRIELYQPDGRLISPVSANLATGAWYAYYATLMDVTLPSKASGNGLTIDDKSADKYVQMVVAPSHMEAGQQLVIRVACSYADNNRNALFTLTKDITDEDQNFSAGKRTTLLVPISSASTSSWQNAGTVWVKTASGTKSLTAPVFKTTDSSTSTFESDWGDDTVEDYVAGLEHQYSSSIAHTAQFDYFGTMTEVSFPSLRNISEIDFSGFNK